MKFSSFSLFVIFCAMALRSVAGACVDEPDGVSVVAFILYRKSRSMFTDFPAGPNITLEIHLLLGRSCTNWHVRSRLRVQSFRPSLWWFNSRRSWLKPSWRMLQSTRWRKKFNICCFWSSATFDIFLDILAWSIVKKSVHLLQQRAIYHWNMQCRARVQPNWFRVWKSAPNITWTMLQPPRRCKRIFKVSMVVK